MKKIFKYLSSAIPIIIFLLFGFFLLQANFGAKLGIVDDHEIAMFLGGDGRVKVNEIPSLLGKTEVGQYGKALRFRPVYYTLRIVETMIFGDNALAWYIARYLMTITFMYIVWRILTNYFPTTTSYLFVFSVFTIPFWRDLLTRLGPSEIYTMPAFVLFVWAVLKLTNTKNPSKKIWLSLITSYIIAVGSKENFLFLLPLLFVVAGIRIYKKWVSYKVELPIYLGLTVFGLFVMYPLVVATANSGVDFYDTPISYPDRVREFVRILRYIIQSRHIEFATLVGVIATINVVYNGLKSGFKKALKQKYVGELLVLAIVFVVMFSQYIFYNNTLPTLSRYDFPALLLFPLMNLIAVKIVADRTRAKLVVYTLVNLVLLVNIFTKGYSQIRTQAEINARQTQVFEAGLKKIEHVAKNNPEMPLIIASTKPLDYEPIVSLSRFLRADQVTNSMELEYQEPMIKTTDQLKTKLNSELINISKNGGDNESGFKEYRAFRDSQNCLVFELGEAMTQTKCEKIDAKIKLTE